MNCLVAEIIPNKKEEYKKGYVYMMYLDKGNCYARVKHKKYETHLCDCSIQIHHDCLEISGYNRDGKSITYHTYRLKELTPFMPNKK